MRDPDTADDGAPPTPAPIAPAGADPGSLAPAAEAVAPRRSLIGLDRDDFVRELKAIGEPAFRAHQLWKWVYGRGATDFAGMTDLAKSLRTKLVATHAVARPRISRALTSIDGTRKWLLRFADGQEVETVHIPEDDRGTLCVSSQVGCTLTCKFCHTGTQRLVRNLEAAEIVGQLMLARDALEDWPSSRADRAISNVVLMGMGEPLYNYDNVGKALRIMLDGEGISLSRRKITLSTAGVVPMIRRCGEEFGVNLAVSLHAVTDEIRDHIVPINKKYPIAELMAALTAYPGVSNARRITFEYVMLKGVNDSAADARALVQLIAPVPAKVNLIPFNPWPGAPFECSTPEAIERFVRIVMDAGYASPIRTPRGRDILAACGQLKSESVRQSRKAREGSGAAGGASMPNPEQAMSGAGAAA